MYIYVTVITHTHTHTHLEHFIGDGDAVCIHKFVREASLGGQHQFPLQEGDEGGVVVLRGVELDKGEEGGRWGRGGKRGEEGGRGGKRGKRGEVSITHQHHTHTHTATQHQYSFTHPA